MNYIIKFKKKIDKSIKNLKNFIKGEIIFINDVFTRNNIADHIIVNGFWRSGTTLLLETLTKVQNGKSLFEPFQPIYEYNKILDRYYDFTNSEKKVFYPFYSKSEELNKYLKKVLDSNIKGFNCRRTRDKIFCHSKLLCIKFVRGHLLIPYLINNLNLKVIHIRRNIYSVVASILRDNWGGWFNDIDLSYILLGVDDGRQNYFLKYRNFIENNNSNMINKIVAYHLLSEKWIDDQNILLNNQIYIIRYEDFILDPKKTISNIPFIKTNLPDSFILKKSNTTVEKRKNASQLDHLNSWKYELGDNKIIIDKIINEFETFG